MAGGMLRGSVRCLSALRNTAPRRMVVMSDASLRSDSTPPPTATNAPADWEKVLEYSKSDAMTKVFTELKADQSRLLEVMERPAGSVDYDGSLPRGGMRSIDWGSLQEVVTSDVGKNKLAEVKVVVDEIQDWIRENDTPVESIDWKHYHAQLDGVVPGFVDKSKAVLERVLESTPDIDLSPQVKLLEGESTVVAKAVAAYVEGIDAMKAELDSDLAAIESETSVPDMTTEQVMTLYPELAAEIEKEIAEGDWEV